MKIFHSLAAIALLISLMSGCDRAEKLYAVGEDGTLLDITQTDRIAGKDLYLTRGGAKTETHRAVFDYAWDCQLVVKALAEFEPNADWHCR